jgi:Histidine kinase-, DNA gyrase B-, and HSP90-like ATPase
MRRPGSPRLAHGRSTATRRTSSRPRSGRPRRKPSRSVRSSTACRPSSIRLHAAAPAALIRRRRGERAAPPGLPKVLADPGRIEQILLILLQNSLDAFRSRAARLPDPIGVVGHIDISGAAVGDRLHCRIADDGPGVSPSMRGQLFAPFATSKPDGRGLGLWAATRARGAAGCRRARVDRGADDGRSRATPVGPPR